VQFLRTRPLSLDPARPDVTLIARDIDAADPGRLLFLVGAARPVPAGARRPGSRKRCSTCTACASARP
jgi:hypothetical protein